VKTEEERQNYGGFANVALDTCYHQVRMFSTMKLLHSLLVKLIYKNLPCIGHGS